MHPRARHAAEDHFRRQTISVRRVFDLFRHEVTLLALERAAVGPTAQMNLVRADADGRDRVVAQGVEGGRGVPITAVAALAVARRVVDDAIDVALGGDEMPV